MVVSCPQLRTQHLWASWSRFWLSFSPVSTCFGITACEKTLLSRADYALSRLLRLCGNDYPAPYLMLSFCSSPFGTLNAKLIRYMFSFFFSVLDKDNGIVLAHPFFVFFCFLLAGLTDDLL